MSNTSPLRRDPVGSTKTDLHDVVTNDLTQHYLLNSAGIQAQRQYADLALILKKKQPGF